MAYPTLKLKAFPVRYILAFVMTRDAKATSHSMLL